MLAHTAYVCGCVFEAVWRCCESRRTNHLHLHSLQPGLLPGQMHPTHTQTHIHAGEQLLAGRNHAPSSPNSRVHSSYLVSSSDPTEDLAFFITA